VQKPVPEVLELTVADPRIGMKLKETKLVKIELKLHNVYLHGL